MEAIGKLEHTLKLMEEDIAHLGEDYNKGQTIVENLENWV